MANTNKKLHGTVERLAQALGDVVVEVIDNAEARFDEKLKTRDKILDSNNRLLKQHGETLSSIKERLDMT